MERARPVEMEPLSQMAHVTCALQGNMQTSQASQNATNAAWGRTFLMMA